MARPLGGEYLEDEVRRLRESGVDVLVSLLEDHEVEEILKRDTDLEQKLEDLIADGNARGGLDNITAVLVRVEAD